MALWLKQQSSLQLFLLGRSGRAGSDSLLGPLMSSNALVSMARSDVASSEEAAYSAHAAGRTGSGTLQVTSLPDCQHMICNTEGHKLLAQVEGRCSMGVREP